MAKKKRQKKKKESESTVYSLDEALKSTIKTESDLQGLLGSLSNGTGTYQRKTDSESKIEPKLFYDTEKAKKIAEEYALEGVPLIQRERVKERKKIVAEKPTIEKSPVPVSVEKEIKKESNLYDKLGMFFKEMFEGNGERYNQWETSISTLLTILRKMRKITKKNTEELVLRISQAYAGVQDHLEQFKTKRDEIESIAGVNIENMSIDFKKVLGLLELQVKEYQLKRFSDELFH